MTETTILDDSAVSEIEARKTNSYGSMVNLPVAERDALFATVTHLIDREKSYAKVLHDRMRELNALVDSFDKVEAECEDFRSEISKIWGVLGISEETGKSVSEHVADLQSQLEQLRAENVSLRSQVAEAEKAAEKWYHERY